MRFALPALIITTLALQANAQPTANPIVPLVGKQNIRKIDSPEKIPSAKSVLAEAQGIALKENKKVLVLFHASWCGWCKKMEKAMNEPALKTAFEKNYVIRWLTVYEAPNKKEEENPGAEDLLKQYKGNDLGIPYFFVFDAKGKMLADSQKSPGENIGCPAEPDEVAYFISVLKKTGNFSEGELQLVAERFKKNKS